MRLPLVLYLLWVEYHEFDACLQTVSLIGCRARARWFRDHSSPALALVVKRARASPGAETQTIPAKWGRRDGVSVAG